MLENPKNSDMTLAAHTNYTVLARKYRPHNFEDLVGQESMVQTLRNAFKTQRIAHAFMLTGVRGVGKTTTARILARALNYERDDYDMPCIHLTEMGKYCADIMAGHHIDIIEMDAASKGGIDDIREIIESVRYKPISARYKIYILDEVHMLSTAAFNGLLKTLEEPPEHAKFIFATTEIRKVPVTILSRCQRFDLRRLKQEEIIHLLTKVSHLENIQINNECLALIARASEGSARDALSLLDRVFAHNNADSSSLLTADELRKILGLADRNSIFDLFEHLMKGEIAEALQAFSEQYYLGADPAVILADLAELTYWLTRQKYIHDISHDITLSESIRIRGEEMAKKLSIRNLSRLWQVLLQGHNEVLHAPNHATAAEMVLIKLAHIADMPTPEELLKQWQEQSNQTPPLVSQDHHHTDHVKTIPEQNTKTPLSKTSSEAIMDDPLIKKVLDTFPGAEIEKITPIHKLQEDDTSSNES